MSKLRLAEYHYRKAVEIHPNNAVLLGCVGMVSEMNRGFPGMSVDDVCILHRLLSDGVTVMQHLGCLMKQ